MKHLKFVSCIMLIAFALLPSIAEAQNKNNTDEAIKAAVMALTGQAKLDDNNIYDVVEEMPQFPGGPSALFEYLAENIRYPKDAKDKGIMGSVGVTFVVEPDGSTSNVKVNSSANPLLDKEAVRIVESMPHWIPGKQNGYVVRVKYTVPVRFRLY